MTYLKRRVMPTCKECGERHWSFVACKDGEWYRERDTQLQEQRRRAAEPVTFFQADGLLRRNHLQGITMADGTVILKQARETG